MRARPCPIGFSALLGLRRPGRIVGPRLRQLRHALRARLGPRAGPRAHARPTRAARARRRTRWPTLVGRAARPLRRRRDDRGAASIALPRASARSAGSSTGSAREWFNPAAGVLAAAIVLTRRPVLDFGARAYVDIPYLVLVLGALLRRDAPARAPGAPVLALLGGRRAAAPRGVAVHRRLPRLAVDRRRARPCASSRSPPPAPLLWCLSDLAAHRRPAALADGHPRHRRDARAHDRAAATCPLTMPRRLGEILREPVLVGAAGGGVLSLWLLRARAALGAAAGVLAVVAFCVLAAAGLPILARYLLLPAAILAMFCGAGVFGWAELPREAPVAARAGRPSARSSRVAAARLRARRRSSAHRRAAATPSRARTRSSDDLHALAPTRDRAAPRSRVPNHRPVPLLALWLDRPPQRRRQRPGRRAARGTYVDAGERRGRKATTSSTRATRPGDPAAPAGLPPGRRQPLVAVSSALQ